MRALLYIDDQEEELQALRLQLGEQYCVYTCKDGSQAVSQVRERQPDVVLLDINMPGYDGFRVLSELRSLPDPPPILMLSGYAEPFFVVRAMKEGAGDFLSKPFTPEMVLRRIEGLMNKESMNEKIRNQKNQTCAEVLLPNHSGTRGTIGCASLLIGSSKAMQQVRALILGYARSDMPVLILGESGTGKDVVARCLHLSSKRALGPYEVRNVAAFPETLVESELFGSEEGAYTGARKREGCFEAAHGGTLFLDEIGDAGAALQASLLRVVEDGVIRRLGGNRGKRVDCRLVFATNRNLELKHQEKPFRSDLFYRISTLSLELPALRDRLEDIPELATFFLQAHTGAESTFSSTVLDLMLAYTWPGNVRQLKSSIDRALVLSAGAPPGPQHFHF